MARAYSDTFLAHSDDTPLPLQDVLGTGWEQPSATRMVFVNLHLDADPSGTTSAEMDIYWDYDGNGTQEELQSFVADAGLGREKEATWGFFLPPGGQFKVENVSDPDGQNRAEAAIFVL